MERKCDSVVGVCHVTGSHQDKGVQDPRDVIGVMAVGVVPFLPAPCAVAGARRLLLHTAPYGQGGVPQLQTVLVGCDACQGPRPSELNTTGE